MKDDYKENKGGFDMNNENRNQKNSSSLLSIYVCLLMLLLVGVGAGIWMIKTGKYEFVSNNNSNNEERKVVLKQTNSTTIQSDGVYITDVSDIVDEVMSSIVAITSKTVIKSGQYGPFFGGGSYTTEGAGSGVLVSENEKGEVIGFCMGYKLENDRFSINLLKHHFLSLSVAFLYMLLKVDKECWRKVFSYFCFTGWYSFRIESVQYK